MKSHADPRASAVDNTYELGGSDDERERSQNAALIEQLERKKRLRKMAVPTDDKKVRERLRAYGEPITLFGEGVSGSERRERKRKPLACASPSEISGFDIDVQR